MNTVLIDCTVDFVKEKLHGAEAGHDWFHIERVWKLSKKIAETENCNQEVVELSVLLHDIADPKFHGGDETLALKISREFLEREKNKQASQANIPKKNNTDYLVELFDAISLTDEQARVLKSKLELPQFGDEFDSLRNFINSKQG